MAKAAAMWIAASHTITSSSASFSPVRPEPFDDNFRAREVCGMDAEEISEGKNLTFHGQFAFVCRRQEKSIASLRAHCYDGRSAQQTVPPGYDF
jgi:hypothetical protein